MLGRNGSLFIGAAVAVLAFRPNFPLFAQDYADLANLPACPAPAVCRLTLEEAQHRALENSKVLTLASFNIQGKEHATKAAKADYFPKILGSVVYFHFDDPLGTVLTTRGRPLLGVPPTQITANVLNQDSPMSTVFMAQPVTALLKVHQGVKIARADEHIAQAQLEQATRAVLAGVEQLYWGLLAAQRIRAGALVAVRAAEQAAQSQNLEARTAFLEARQGLHEAEKQVADIAEQLNQLLDLPPCTCLEPVEPPLPVSPFGCADEAVEQALAASPEVRKAEQDVVKARAALCAAKVDYLPNVNLLGGYANQEAADYIQPDFAYVGVFGSWSFFEWGKRKHTVCERETLVAMAQLKVRSTQDEVRLKAQKAFREFEENWQALRNAEEMALLRREAEKAARSPADLLAAVKARMLGEAELVKAELAYRVAFAKLMSLIGKP